MPYNGGQPATVICPHCGRADVHLMPTTPETTFEAFLRGFGTLLLLAGGVVALGALVFVLQRGIRRPQLPEFPPARQEGLLALSALQGPHPHGRKRRRQRLPTSTDPMQEDNCSEGLGSTPAQ
jgi:hypothetical protein